MIGEGEAKSVKVQNTECQAGGRISGVGDSRGSDGKDVVSYGE